MENVPNNKKDGWIAIFGIVIGLGIYIGIRFLLGT